MRKLFCKIFGHTPKTIHLPSMTYLNRHLIELWVTKCKVCDLRINVKEYKDLLNKK